MKKRMAAGIGGVLTAAILAFSVCQALGQDVNQTARAIDEKARINLSSSPRGPYGSISVDLNNNSLVDSYNSSHGAWSPLTNSGDNVEVGSGDPDISDSGNLTIYGNAVVKGDIAVSGSIINPQEEEITQHPGVTGEIISDADPWDLKPISLSGVPAVGEYTGEITGEVYSIIPAGSFTSFTAEQNSQLSFSPGVYHFYALTLKNNAEVHVGTGSGNNGIVQIYVGAGGITFSQNSSFIPPAPGDTTRLRIYYYGVSKVAITENNVEFYGFIYAPNAEIEVSQNVDIYGNLVGKNILLNENSAVHYDEMLASQDFSDIFEKPSGSNNSGRKHWEEKIFP